MPPAQTSLRYDMVVFDVGGTLIGFYDHAPFQEFLAASGLPASAEEGQCLHRRLISVLTAQRDRAQGLGAHDHELNDWWRDNLSRTWPERPDLAESMFDWLLAGRFDRLFPDVLPTLEALQSLGMRLGILSNFGVHLKHVLDSLDLLDHFEFVIVSAEAGLAKPDPRIFDLVVEKARRPRQRLLYVGDHIGDDIEGAWKAGLDAVLIDRLGRQPEAHCPRISSLLELPRYVRVPTGPYPAVVFDMDGVVLDSIFVPGIVPLLYDLHGRGYRLGLVTGSARSVVDETLALTGILDLFDTIVGGNAGSHGEPSPEPYQRAATALGLRSAECLAVENAPLGIQSARAAGMSCVALATALPAGVLSDAGAGQVFSDGQALRTWLLSS